MITKNYNCLLDIEEEIEQGTITQEIEATLHDTKVSYIIIRDLEEGGNISDVKNCFENLPFVEDNQIKYDEDLSILQSLFDMNYVEFDVGEHIDQILWDMDVDDEETFEVTFTDPEYKSVTYEVTLKLISDILES